MKELAPRRQVPERGSSYGVDFVVDAGPPRRIAFPQPGRVADNWEGVVYDPSGSLAGAAGWRHSAKGVSATPVELVRLFGGNLLSCEPSAITFTAAGSRSGGYRPAECDRG